MSQIAQPANGLPAPVAELVRPAPAEWKRLVLLALLAVSAWLVVGSVTPLSAPGAGGLSSSSGEPVEAQFDVRNGSPLPLEIVGAVAPDGVSTIRLADGPVTIGPFATSAVALRATVADCGAIDRYRRDVTLRVRAVPTGWVRSMDVELPYLGAPDDVDGFVGGPDTGWLAAATDGTVCPEP